MKGEVYYSLLIKNKNYLLIWVSLLLSLCGDWFNYVAALSLISQYIPAEEDNNLNVWATTGYVVVRLVPPLFFLPLISWWIDRVDKRLTMIASNLIRSVLVLGYLFVKSRQDLWIIYTIAFLELGLMGFYDPARRGYIPLIVEENELAVANIIDGVTWSTIMAVGSAIGGFLTDYVGTSVCFEIDSGCYVVASLILGVIWLNTRNQGTYEEKEPLLTEPSGINTDLLETPKGDKPKGAIHFLRHNPLVLAACFCKMAGAVGWGIMNLTVIEVAQNDWRLGYEGSVSLGILLAIRGFCELVVPIVSEAFLSEEKKSSQKHLYYLILSGFAMEFVGTMIQSWTFLPSPGSAASTSGSIISWRALALFIAGNVVRTSGDANNWCFTSAFLAVAMPQEIMGRIFSFENAMYVIGESTGTVIGAAAQTTGKISFLPESISDYLRSVMFIAMLVTTLNLTTYVLLFIKHRRTLKNH